MPTHSPVEFNRWVQVRAGEEKYEPCTLSNDYAQNELFQLRISEDSTPGEVVARVPVAVRQQETLELSVRAPEDSEPGVFPFTVIADLESRNLRLNMPGLRVVPPLGGWKAELQPGPELKLRPWQNGASATIELTNQSNDWLYCDIQVLNTNNAWDYQINSRRVCLPPWVDANRKHGAANNSMTAALISGASTRDDRPLAPVPTKNVRLVARPKKKKWFGAMPEGTGETNVTLKISRLNPETGGSAAHVEHQLRVIHVPMKGPGDLWQALQPALQRIGAFFRFLFSKQGFFVAGGIVAAVMLLTFGPLNIWYTVRDFLWQPKVVVFEPEMVKPSYAPGEKILLKVGAENVDEITIKGGPKTITYRNPKDRPKNGSRDVLYTGIPDVIPVYAGDPGSNYVLDIEARRLWNYGNGTIAGGRKAMPVHSIPVHVDALTAGTIGSSGSLSVSGGTQSAPAGDLGGGSGAGSDSGNGPSAGNRSGTDSGASTESGAGAQHQPAGVFQLTTGGSSTTYAKWAAEALGLKVNDTSAPSAYKLVIVGPDRVKGRPKIHSGVPVIGIGAGGAEFLQRLDAGHFKPAGEKRLTETGYNPHDMGIFGINPPPGTTAVQVAKRSTLTALIDQDALGVLDQGSPLILRDVTGQSKVVVGWQGKHWFWGLSNPDDLDDTMKELFNFIVQKVSGVPSAPGEGQ